MDWQQSSRVCARLETWTLKSFFLIMVGERDWRANLDLCFLLFIWKANCHCQRVFSSSCTLSHALTIALSLLVQCNCVCTNTHRSALTEREYCCIASYWTLSCNLNLSLDFVLEGLHCVACMILHLFRGPNVWGIPCRRVQESRMYPRGCKIPGSAGV